MRRSGGSFAAWAAGMILSLGVAAAEPPPSSALFTGRPHDFERSSDKVVGVYVPSWQPVALVDGLPGGSVTHLLYAFLRICGPGQQDKDAPACAGKSEHQLAERPIDASFDEAFARLKKRAPHVKVLASVGGWGGSDPFFHLANEPARRERFAASVAEFLRRHPAFDGVDIDWEHPTSNGSANGVALGTPADGQGYADLMRTLRKTLDALSAETGRPYLVTSAINTNAALVSKINYREAAKSLDLVFLMTYDYFGPWTAQAGHHSALRERGDGRDSSLAGGVKTMLDAGVPAAKLVAGVAMYGRGFTGVVPPAKGAGFNGVKRDGVYAGADGSVPYREIATRYLDAQGNARAGYQLVTDPAAGSWALWHPKNHLYLGYDDPRGVWLKGRFARDQGLAGVFAWELSQDNGDLLNAMNLGLGNLPYTP
ncbi:glycoside hydrolase family 18 protein [Ideonella sp. YS5]|uniref:glycoside hydrolase family 18 protein n=1 Tax=Ideonella sp. YS5 TaxID=3453714 RepID=UPI003EED17B2